MKIVKPNSVALLTRVFVEKPCLLSVGAMAFFSLDDTPTLFDEPGMWEFAAEALGPETPLDTGAPKPRGEYLVYGGAFDTRQKGYVNVSVQVGEMRKELDVFGDRYWLGDGRSDPAPFDSLPLDWAHAFGGEDFPENPLGKGYLLPGDAEPDNAVLEAHPIPNIMAHGTYLTAPDKTLPPAGLQAYPEDWPQRKRFEGTYDDAWFARRWPGRPVDFDPEYNCTAPEDQRKKGFFTGHETFNIRGMHPEGREAQGRLPELRARIFVLRRSPNKGEEDTFHELESRLETVWLFPGQERGIALFRASTNTSDEECDDIVSLLTEFESLGEQPRPAQFYYSRMQEALAGASPYESPAQDDSAAPPPEESEQAQPADDAQNPLLVEAEQMLETVLATLGISPEDAEAAMEKFELEQAGKEDEALLESSEDALKQLKEQTDKIMEDLGMDEQGLEEFIAQKQAENEAPAPAPGEAQQNLRDFLANNPDLPAEERETIEAGIDGLDQIDALPQDEPAPETPTPEEAEGVAGEEFEVLDKDAVLARHAAGESLQGVDLSGLDLSDLDLSGIDLRDAVLVGAVFAKSNLTGANLSGADCTQGDFSHTLLDQAQMIETHFHGANLQHASLAGGAGSKAVFIAADCANADFSQALLPGADFSQANLVNADFASAACGAARFYETKAMGANLCQAALLNTRADATSDFANACFRGADLSDATWGGARLPGVDLRETTLDRADMSKADLSDATMARATAIKANFTKARLQKTDLRGVNLFEGVLRRADLSGARIEDVNMFAADLYQACLNIDSLKNVNVKRTVLRFQDAEMDEETP